MEEGKSKRVIIAWALYDWANSSFSSVVITFIFAAYFTRSIAVNEIIGTNQWGKAIALSGLSIALLGPIFGAIADHSGRRKVWLGCLTLMTVICCFFLWYAKPASAYVYYTLAFVVIGNVCLEIGIVFYNAMLPTIAPSQYIGRISGWAWGLGYAGGLAALTISLFVFVLGKPAWLDVSQAENIRIAGPFIGLWFGLFSLPLFFFVPSTISTSLSIIQAISRGLRTLGHTLRSLPQQRNLLTFLIARMFYIDGLNTIFAFGGVYAAGTFGMDISEVIKLGISMNIAAGIGAASLAWLDDHLGPKLTIQVSLVGITLLGIGILIVQNVWIFWVLGLMLSLFVGPVQASSRSLMTRLIPPKKTTEMFGLYAFSGKATGFIGPWLLALATLHFNSQRAGMTTIMIFFVIGSLILIRVKEPKRKKMPIPIAV